MGKSVYQLLHPDELAEIKRSYPTIQEKLVTLTFSHSCQRKNGDYIWFETTSQVLRYSDSDRLLEEILLSHDITEDQKTETQRSQDEQSIRQLDQFILGNSILSKNCNV